MGIWVVSALGLVVVVVCLSVTTGVGFYREWNGWVGGQAVLFPVSHSGPSSLHPCHPLWQRVPVAPSPHWHLIFFSVSLAFLLDIGAVRS